MYLVLSSYDQARNLQRTIKLFFTSHIGNVKMINKNVFGIQSLRSSSNLKRIIKLYFT